MPSPLGHTLAGVCGFLLNRQLMTSHHRIWLCGASVVIAILPDFDVVPGLLLGDPRMFHQKGTHSITAAVVVGLLVGGVARRWKLNGLGWGIWGGGLYLSHLLLDLLVEDPSPPFGILLFWPFSEAYFVSPITPFGGFHYYDPAIGMWRTMLSFDNLVLMLHEIVFIAPFAGLAWYVGNYRSQLRSKPKLGQDAQASRPL